MCGIVGYAGNVRTACGKPLEVCLQGLQRLEYRGYDSAGVALTAPGMERVAVRKKAGRLANLVQDIERDPMPDATVGIGHTRWATNGVPNDTNAHPHTSRDGKVAIIHNGIIENASQLRLDLQTEGYRFVSETDTEVAAKLLGKISDKIIEETGKPDLFKAVRRLARRLEGALKLKEIAYTFTEGFAAGELKHGPIALVDEGEPVVFIVPPARGRNVLHAKVISGIEEVKARGAYIIAVAEENDPDVERYADVVFWRPACPTLMSPLVDVVPLQLFAMDMAKLKNYDVDKPRNLAKSVTVE